MERKEKNLRFLLSLTDGIGPKTFQQLMEKYGSARAVYMAGRQDISENFGQKIATNIDLDGYESVIKREFERLEKSGIEITVFGEPNYPELLSEIYDPPIALYSRGKISLPNSQKLISIVGTRNATKQGIEITTGLVRGFVEKGFGIVSGMAIGIDKVVHEATLDANGLTIAVLGGSVHRPSPYINSKVYNKIVERGLVLSEYGIESEMSPGNFPRRNRIISGISLGTVVIEAGERSGALITAYSACDQNREVFAVPWDIGHTKGVGCNKLIKEGKAKLAQNIEDILVEFGYIFGQTEEQIGLYIGENELEKTVLSVIGSSPVTTDEIAVRTGKDINSIISVLAELEIKGIIMNDEVGEWRILVSGKN